MKKCRGRIGISYDMLHAILGLPEEVSIEFQAEGDHARGVGYFYIRSDEAVEGLTFPTREAQHPKDADHTLTEELAVKRMKKHVHNYEYLKGREI